MRDERAEKICKKLSVVGIVPIRKTSARHEFDPIIDITQNIYLQVGEDYVFIVMNDSTGTPHFFESDMTISKILSCLKDAHKLFNMTEDIWKHKK